MSLFQDICGILGISINEFFAGEDIAREAVEEQSEKNILAILKDSVHRNSKLKKTIKSLVAALVLVGLCPYNGVNSKIVLYLFLGGTALSGIKKSNLNLTMSKSMLGCASLAGTSGESATCHLAAA